MNRTRQLMEMWCTKHVKHDLFSSCGVSSITALSPVHSCYNHVILHQDQFLQWLPADPHWGQLPTQVVRQERDKREKLAQSLQCTSSVTRVSAISEISKALLEPYDLAESMLAEGKSFDDMTETITAVYDVVASISDPIVEEVTESKRNPISETRLPAVANTICAFQIEPIEDEVKTKR